MLRIGLDLDGVIYEFEPTARYILEHYKGYKLAASDEWDAIKRDVSTEDWQWLWREGITQHGLFRHGSIYKGAAEGVKALATLGDLVLITSRPKIATVDTLKFLAYHELPFSEVHILSPGSSKSAIRCDLYVDDNEKNIQELRKNTDAVVLMWDRPWNQSLLYSERVFEWGAVYKNAKYLKERDYK